MYSARHAHAQNILHEVDLIEQRIFKIIQLLHYYLQILPKKIAGNIAAPYI